MNLGNAMCVALIDGWHGGWKMSRVVSHAWRLTETEPENETAKYLDAASAVKVSRIYHADAAQTWIARNIPQLNDALWASRPRDTCVSVAMKACGIKRANVGVLNVGVRERDKRTDWKTCK